MLSYGEGKPPLFIMKNKCSVCDLEVFSKGFCTKHYRKNYYLTHKEKHNNQMAEWRRVNKERSTAMVKRAFLKKREEYLAKRKLWAQANKGRVNAKTARRRAKRLKAQPAWLTPLHIDQMTAIYLEAKKIHLAEVDHIIPLQGKNVSGLNVPWNLRITHRSENRQKSNSLPPHSQQLAVL